MEQLTFLFGIVSYAFKMHFLQSNKNMQELQPHKLQVVVTCIEIVPLKVNLELDRFIL